MGLLSKAHPVAAATTYQDLAPFAFAPKQASATGVIGFAAAAATGAALYWVSSQPKLPESIPLETAVALSNWSGTHSVTALRVFSPESQAQLEELVAWATKNKQKIRPVGTSLSPNGLALERRGMLSMAQLDGIVKVEPRAGTVTVQAGARVSQILDELRKHGLTLENFSSITEQQIGGWTQVSAHGTGARIPPVDEMVTAMTLVTPGKGTLRLEKGGPQDELFKWARVGLGALGVVSEVTLKVIPQYTLHERTYCSTVEEVRRQHAQLLQDYRHVRYMWIPFTDTVVVVVSDIAKPGVKVKPPLPEEERVKPLEALLQELNPNCGDLKGQNFAQLRERLLVLDPLNPDHVARVNRVEAEFWKRSEGERVADSTEILGFECGGVQWVLENCFSCGTIDRPSLRDIDYVVELKQLIEREKIPAASPIEQRWTSRSSSPMSPSFSTQEKEIFSWVGVIMYITDEANAPAIKSRFREYAMQHADLTFKYGGCFHWGKLDLDFHEGTVRRKALLENLRSRFNLGEFRRVREELDPQRVLSNRLVDTISA